MRISHGPGLTGVVASNLFRNEFASDGKFSADGGFALWSGFDPVDTKAERRLGVSDGLPVGPSASAPVARLRRPKYSRPS